ncbi:MAG TPA: hypothetical protein DCP91_09130, partial [Eggerthellaceae bacterium]|nr:hypothetical protein [Eggerthellaceae bacterium]
MKQVRRIAKSHSMRVFTSFFLSFVLAMGLVPVPVFAAPTAGSANQQAATVLQAGSLKQQEEVADSGESPAAQLQGGDAAKEGPATQVQDESGASIHAEGDLYEVMVYGQAADTHATAAQAIAGASRQTPEVPTLSLSAANTMAASLFAAPGPADETYPDGDYPRRADGQDIETIAIRWLTEDTEGHDDGSASRLNLVPNEDSPFTVRFQLDYALSGERHYEPGDIKIKIPAQIFHKRSDNTVSDDGGLTGTMVIPLAQSPSTNTDFNWQLIDGEYVLSNTKTIVAATKGFVQFEIKDLVPHSIVDMSITDELQATIEVLTYLGNTIGLKSNKIDAQVNTTQEVVRANKDISGDPKIEGISSVGAVPARIKAKYPNDTEFLVITWYTNAYHTGNQPYTLTGYDTRTDVATGATTQTLHDGWVIDGDTETTKDLGVVQKGWYTPGISSSSSIKVAYPMSQFEKDTVYTFTNHVDYDLVPIDEVDDPTHVEADASTTWSYRNPKWIEPVGHFNVFKWGNDNDYGVRKDGDLTTHYHTSSRDDIPATSGTNTSPQHLMGWYGLYKKALNEMREGNDAEIAYTIKSDGYVLPWTYEGDTRLQSSYGKRPVTMVTEDTGLWVGSQTSPDFDLVPGDNMEFTSISFVKPIISKIKAINVNPDGSFATDYITVSSSGTASDGTFDYEQDTDDSKIPPVVLEVLRNGKWEKYASADFTSGSCVITLADGTVVNGDKIDFPAGTQNFRTSVTTGNAAIVYCVRPSVLLKNTQQWRDHIESLFQNDTAPTEDVWNGVNLKAYTAEKSEIVDISKDGFDRLMGFTDDIEVRPYKEGKVGSIDYENKKVPLHYKAYIEERSVIADLDTYVSAIEEGVIQSETHGWWYDLLPLGVTPDLDSIKLRKGDTVVDAYTIPDYKGTGRMLMVVECDFTPTPETYTEEGVNFYEDKPSIEFDASCDTGYIIDYGQITEPDKLFEAELHNVIAFESSNDVLGTIEGYQGEANDPNGTNNVRTREAWSSKEDEAAQEKMALTGLHDGRSTASFLYAGDPQQVKILNAASTSLVKDVSVNNDGWWSQGTYYGNREANARNVYEGGMYSYRIFAMSNNHTQTKDMVIYDSLENYEAWSGNDQEDVDAINAGKIWRGTLRSVDTSLLRAAGIDAVVYYSTVPELEIQKVDDPNGGYINPTTTNLDDPNYWVKATDYTGDLGDVHAIAIDCRKALDGSDYILEPDNTITAYIHMWAPQGEEADHYITNDHHAYNNIFLNCTSIDTRVGGQGDTHLVRQDYVKVGLVENSVNVTKQWNDDDDRDGIRPSEVTYTLLRDGQVYQPIDSEHPDQPAIENPVTVPVEEDGSANYTFKYLPYCDDEGRVFNYTVREEPVDGYTPRVVRANDGHDITIINTHEPEQTEVSGNKTWVGDTASTRPASIKVKLLADGELSKTQTVTPDADGFWSYSFTGLNKYRDHGTEIAYTVEEEHTVGSPLESYVTKVEGSDIINTYHPFGDVELVKSVTGATSITRNDTFDFDFTIADSNGVPVFDEYAYEIVNARGYVYKRGMVTTGTTLTMGDSQVVRIKEVPRGYKVTAMENVPAGYTAYRDGIIELTVKPNQTVSATAYNAYKTEGLLNLHVTKVLTGRDMKNYQFRFNLTTDEVGGDVVTAASSSLDGSVVFDALRFSNIDDGTVRTFYMHELDFGRPGYTYDDSVYKVEIKVDDNGDGTMTATPTYFQRGPLDIGWVQMQEAPEFKNEYHAEGDLEVKAWKALKKRDLKEGEFTYELVDSKGAVVATATNDATGTVAFPKVHFDETSIGAELDYTIREKAGSDKTVIYSGETYKVHVVVSDNGDGTLSFDQAVTGADGEAATPVITNDLKDGKLAVEKVVEQTDVPNPEFKFKVKFSGPDVPKDGSYSFTKEQIGQNSNKAAVASNKMLSPSNLLGQLGDGLSSAGREVAGLFTPEKAYAAASDGVFHAPASMLQGEAYAVYDSDTKVFEFFRDEPGKYENGHTDGTKTYYTGIEVEDEYGPGDYIVNTHWKSAIKRATTIRVAEGVAVRPIGYIDLQGTYNNTTENIDFSRIDTSRITYLKMDGSYTQDGQGYVSIVGLENLDTSNMTNIRMAGDFGKYGLLYGDFDLSNWSGQSLVSMYNMFEDQRELVSLDLSGLSTPNVTNMYQAFSSMSKLERLDISSLDTSKVVDEGYFTGMNGMFSGSSNLKEVVLGPNFNFRGAGIEDASHWAKLPTPKKSSEYTGKWTCVEHPEYSLTSTELAEQYDGPTMYGTWVWEKYEFRISYAAEEDGSNIYSTSPKIPKDSLADYELPNYSYNDRAIAGWKLVYPDGTGSEGSDPFKGYRDLGAQPVGKTFGEITANGKSLDATLIEQAQTHATFAPVFLTTYQVDFLPGEGAGSMASLTERPITEDTVIPASTFYAFNKQVGSWVDDLGNVYPAEGTIPANTVNRPVVTLTAQWIPVENKIDMKDGEFEFTLRGNERAIFDNIPAGTAYQVWEETPAGWVLVKSVDETGRIEPLETATATFTNEYNPNAASAQLTAMKLLDNQPAPEADKFSFTLSEGSTVRQTKTNAAGGGVTFDPIVYERAGTYTYTIAEDKGDDPNIIYTGATYTATVTVKDDGAGKLTATVAYADVDGRATAQPTFRNESKTGSLSLQKKVTGTGAPADAEFTFVVALSAAGDFPYRTESGTEGRIRNGGTITLKGNDWAYIGRLPFGTTY